MARQATARSALRSWGRHAPAGGGILRIVWTRLLNWQQRASDRRHVEALSDQHLRDIGLTRDELLCMLR